MAFIGTTVGSCARANRDPFEMHATTASEVKIRIVLILHCWACFKQSLSASTSRHFRQTNLTLKNTGRQLRQSTHVGGQSDSPNRCFIGFAFLQLQRKRPNRLPTLAVAQFGG